MKRPRKQRDDREIKETIEEDSYLQSINCCKFDLDVTKEMQ